MAEYTPLERETLDIMGRTNFSHLKSSEIVGLYSRFAECRPEVQREIVAQFPVFARLAATSLETCRSILSEIIESDDNSVEHVYEVINRDMDALAEDDGEYYNLASKIQADVSKCLDDPSMTPNEKLELIDREMELLRQVGEKNTETKEHRKETVRIAAEKDTEKRDFDRDAVLAACMTIASTLGSGIALLGVSSIIRLPKKP